MLLGQMMDFPLTLTRYLERARSHFPTAQITWRRPDKTVVSASFEMFATRAARLANALKRLGVGEGDRVATLCWNHAAHLEAYYGVPAYSSCSGNSALVSPFGCWRAR